ncbi:MAG TPA: ribosome biogenesis factor YjgA [Burkholderiales bacterium]
MRNRTLLVNPEPPPKPEYDRPSKSQVKRDMEALQELGREVAELPRERITELDLPEKLYDALIHYQKITAHEGKRRQYQYIGKLMRNIDPQPLRDAVDRFKGESKAEVGDMHLAERWRERLLDEEGALAEFASAYPETDMQQLRTLIRNTKKERGTQKPPRDFRKLYQLVREQIDARRKASAITDAAGEDNEDEE